MSTQRKRSRTAYGRTPLTSQQLVDEMGASQEFPSPELFAVRKCQVLVDAAKQGAIRGRRLSATNKLLNQRPSEEDITSTIKPSHSRARSDTFGLLSRTDSFDDAEREYKSEVEILELELQEKSLELKLAAEIGQMLLEKEQKLSERCQKYETNERRMKTELQGLDDENQILHRKFLAAQKRSKDFQNENFALSEDIRSKEKELSRLSVLAEECEKMRKNLNLANVQLMTLKNQHRNLEKQARSPLCQEERLRVTAAEAAHSSGDSSSIFTNTKLESIGDKVTVHQQTSSPLKTETIKSPVKEVSSSLAENVLAEDACLHEHCGTTFPQDVVLGAHSYMHTVDGNHDPDTHVARFSHENSGDGSAGLALVLELDQLKREVAENQKSEKKWLKNAKKFEEVICDEREQSEQLRIELGVSKETLRNLLEQVIKLEQEAEENRNIIASLRLTVEEQKNLLEEHEYYESTDDVRVTSRRVVGLENQNSADCNEDDPYICRLNELTALVEQLKLENSSLRDALQVQASLKSSPRRVQASHRKALSDASALEESNAKLGPVNMSRETASAASLVNEQLESIKVKLCEKEMAILRYKNIAAEWRRQQKPAFIVETSTECEEGGDLSYTVYKITMVSHDGREHRVKKRFRDFMAFFVELERHLFLTNTVVRLPQIPPKVWGRKRSMSPKVVTERRERLKEFLVIMAALTDSSGEIAQQFWEFLQYKPTPRNLRMLSFSPDESEEGLRA